MGLLLLAFLSRQLLSPSGTRSDDADFIIGLLFGVAIGFLVWSLARGRMNR